MLDMKKTCLLLLSCLLAAAGYAENGGKGFTLKGCIKGLPDGYEASLISAEDLSAPPIAIAIVKDGRFELKGTLKSPTLCTFITNNQQLVQKNNWPVDSTRWTYTSVFMDNSEMEVKTPDYQHFPKEDNWTPDFSIEGGTAQKDYNDYSKAIYGLKGNKEQKGCKDSITWQFIQSHPNSVVSTYFANRLLDGAYRLTKAQVALLQRSIQSLPSAPSRFAVFQKKMAYAPVTTVGDALLDLELTDVNGRKVALKSLVPAGRYVFLDFWASWCGICLYSMPDIKKMLSTYKNRFTVIGISCDKNADNWKKAIAKHQLSWKQYRLTDKGFQDFLNKYRVGNGVPYYLLVAPDGKVLLSPEHITDCDRIFKTKLNQ